MRLTAVLLLAAGCSQDSLGPTESSSNPLPDLRTIAVLPVLNQTGKPTFDGEEFGNILASGLLKYPGFRVVRPAVFRGSPVPRSVEEAARLGRRQGVDAVLVVAITDHDPYDPPRVAASVQLLRSCSRSVSPEEIDRLVQSASWRKAPLHMTRDGAGHWVGAFEAVFDAQDGRVRSDLVAYARTQDASDSAFLGEREYLAVQTRYFQFVSDRLLHRMVEQLAAP